MKRQCQYVDDKGLQCLADLDQMPVRDDAKYCSTRHRNAARHVRKRAAKRAAEEAERRRLLEAEEAERRKADAAPRDERDDNKERPEATAEPPESPGVVQGKTMTEMMGMFDNSAAFDDTARRGPVSVCNPESWSDATPSERPTVTQPPPPQPRPQLASPEPPPRSAPVRQSVDDRLPLLWFTAPIGAFVLWVCIALQQPAQPRLSSWGLLEQYEDGAYGCADLRCLLSLAGALLLVGAAARYITWWRSPAQPPDNQQTGFCLTVAGAAGAIYSLGALLNGLWWGLVILPSVTLIYFGCHLWRKHAPTLAAAPTADTSNVVTDLDAPVAALQKVLDNTTPTLEIINYQDAGGELQSYTLRAVKPGVLATQRTSTMLVSKLHAAIKGDWNIGVQPERNTITASLKSPFPAYATPPQAWRAASDEHAAHLYKQFDFTLGCNRDGEWMRYQPKNISHTLLVARTGSGKTSLARTLIEQHRAAGWAVFICGGKQSDYITLRGAPNVVMVTQQLHEHVRLIHACADEIRRREHVARERKTAGHPDPFAFEPWLVVFDEIAKTVAAIAALYKDRDDKDRQFMTDLRYIAQTGREFRVHLLVSATGLYDQTIKRDILNHFGLIVALGNPEKMTVEQAFPNELRREAERIGQRIPKPANGRCIVADVEAGEIIEVQSCYGYSPGSTNINDPVVPAAIRAKWRTWRDQVTTQIPKLYGRKWYTAEGPSDSDLAMADFNALEIVDLDNEHGGPDPGMTCYDPAHPAYNGRTRHTNHTTALRKIKPRTVAEIRG